MIETISEKNLTLESLQQQLEEIEQRVAKQANPPQEDKEIFSWM